MNEQLEACDFQKNKMLLNINTLTLEYISFAIKYEMIKTYQNIGNTELSPY